MRITLNGENLKLLKLTDSEYEWAERLANATGIPLDQCPTCKSKATVIPDSGGVERWQNGTYVYQEQKHACDCQAQIALRARYLVASIGDEFMRLDWERDYDGPEEIKQEVLDYLTNWKNFRDHGIGLECKGPQGTGKTFAATYLGKELVKQGQRVYCIRFSDVVGAYLQSNFEDLEEKLKMSTYLILDELWPASISKSQDAFYNVQLENLIRHRTNFNLPTFITTNMTDDELHEKFPRTYSLLSAKQLPIDFTGDDARMGVIGKKDMELALAGEIRPIS